MSRTGLVALLLNAAVAGHAHGHDAAPAPDCKPPVRPPKEEVARWNAFVDAVDGYRACINRYQAAHYAQSDAHRAAAEASVQAWNTFVRENLNVPEDFPHRPRSTSP